MNDTLVVGYGNALRTDDGLGWHAAQRMGDDPRFVDVAIVRRHQLVPELAYDVGAAALVVFIDATASAPPGCVVVQRVECREQRTGSSTHHVNPPALVALAEELYGRAAEAFIVSCGVDSVDIGERLSPVVKAALPKVIDAVAELIDSRSSP